EAHEAWRWRRLVPALHREDASCNSRRYSTDFIHRRLPGRTEKEFEELGSFVKDAAFDWMGAFGYSDQEGAGAFDHGKKLSSREIESRRKSLMSMQKKISRAKKKSLIG